jgi:nitrogen-specific signal transduction histidine kinase/CheY-like chemotaxis protein
VNVFGGAKQGSNGHGIELFGTVQDITERKRAEEEHLKYEQQLQQNQRLESLGVLAGGIAHDFNNLMAGIYGYIDMAREDSTDDDVKLKLSKAAASIERARGLTAQLLTFAKGGAPIQAIGHLFPFLPETVQFALSGSDVSCHFEAPEDLWACNFDRNQVGQVIDNCVINARQAMPLGGTIELTARNITFAKKEHPLLTGGDYVKISIHDRGIGIPKELLSRIFDPFFTTKASGHGLGLATSFSIVKRHGGCIEVESEPGHGSTFHIFLPAVSNVNSVSVVKPATKLKGNGAIVVMDDEVSVREVIDDMLKSFGYTVVRTQNGSDAVDYFIRETAAKRRIAGMILDLTVPGGMGGKAAVAEIRKLDTTIPVFVASGYALDQVMANPTEYGFTASICKPFRKNELAAMLEKYLAKK